MKFLLPNKKHSNALTLKYKGISRVIFSPVTIISPEDSNKKMEITGIWDTGATGTVITQKVIDTLGLKPTGVATVSTASQSNIQVNTFIINMFLKSQVNINAINVTVGQIADGIDCLIGMDIINLGDFSITNKDGVTCMSFRIPSLEEVDYVKLIQAGNPAQTQSKVGRNDPCPCGSGKKYKKCHGRVIEK